jgi:hypothetical protein
MKPIVYLVTQYIKIRTYMLSKRGWQNTFAFLKLPELKFLKTCGFILSIIF